MHEHKKDHPDLLVSVNLSIFYPKHLKHVRRLPIYEELVPHRNHPHLHRYWRRLWHGWMVSNPSCSVSSFRILRYPKTHCVFCSGPEVVWDRHHNPYPWRNIDQGTQLKLMTVNQQFDKKYSRDRL